MARAFWNLAERRDYSGCANALALACRTTMLISSGSDRVYRPPQLKNPTHHAEASNHQYIVT